MNTEALKRERSLTYIELCKEKASGDLAVQLDHMRGVRPFDEPEVQVVISASKKQHLRSGAVKRKCPR
jgi:hypothetical protein